MPWGRQPLPHHSHSPQSSRPGIAASSLQRRDGPYASCQGVCVCWKGSDPLSLEPLWAALCLREPSSPPARTMSSPTACTESPTGKPWQGQLGEPVRCWFFLLSGTHTPGEPSEHAGLVCSKACRRNPHAPRQSKQPIPASLAPVPVASIFIILPCFIDRWIFSSFALFFITIISIFIITSVPLMAFRYEPPVNLRARLCHDKNTVVYILCQSII